MQILDKAMAEGKIRGVKINNMVHICHRLFADDVGAFLEMDELVFQEFRKCINRGINLYEQAAGACLNHPKLSPTSGLPDHSRVGKKHRLQD